MLALALAIPLAACSFNLGDSDEGPGAAAEGAGNSRTYALADFDEIELRGADNVDVRVGPGFAIRAEGPSDQLDRLRIDKDGDTLKVGRQNGTRYQMGRRSAVKIFVTLPRLAEASVAGSGTMTVDRVDGEKFEGGIAGSGSMRLAGTARALKVEIAGSGDVDAAGLGATSAEIEIAGSGDVRARVNGMAKIDMMGSGNVDLGPNARCTISKMGSGNIRCGN